MSRTGLKIEDIEIGPKIDTEMGHMHQITLRTMENVTEGSSLEDLQADVQDFMQELGYPVADKTEASYGCYVTSLQDIRDLCYHIMEKTNGTIEDWDLELIDGGILPGKVVIEIAIPETIWITKRLYTIDRLHVGTAEIIEARQIIQNEYERFLMDKMMRGIFGTSPN